MLEEGFAAARARLTDEGGVGGEKFQERDEGGRITGIDLPAAAEAANDAGRSSFPRSDVKNGTAGGHEAIGLAGDDRTERNRLLGDQADVAGAEALRELMPGPVAGKRSVGYGVFPAKGFERLALRSGAGESEAEAGVGTELMDGAANGFDIVGEPEVPRVEHGERGVLREGERVDFAAIGPVFGDVDEMRGDTVSSQAGAHAFAQGDDAVGPAAGAIESRTHGARTPGARLHEIEIDCDIGIDIHLPDEVAGSGEGFEEGADDAERRGRGEGEDEIRPGAEEAIAERAGEIGDVREEPRDQAVAERQAGGTDDFDWWGFQAVGLRVGTAGADHAGGVAVGGEQAG